MKRIPMRGLIEFASDLMVGKGMDRGDAEYVARIIVETEAYRQSSHGIVQLPMVVEGLGNGLDPAARGKVLRQQGVVSVVDGKNCVPALAVRTATQMAVRNAKQYGVGFSSVQRTGWVGALGMHIVAVAEQGFLCKAWAQANTCKDCAPLGGTEAKFSTNPIAIAIPADGTPVLSDFSTASVSLSTTSSMAEAGKKTAGPRFLDRGGRPSRDPGVVRNGGTIMFMGCQTDGHKGYGLSLFNEALAALAGGSANNPEAESAQSVSLLVLDPDAFASRDYFVKEMTRFTKHVRSSSPINPENPVRLPGERGFVAVEDCKTHGLPLDEGKLGMLRNLARDNNVQFDAV